MRKIVLRIPESMGRFRRNSAILSAMRSRTLISVH